MKINTINNTNFRGIRILKKQNTTTNPRQKQSDNLQNAKQQMGLLDSLAEFGLRGKLDAFVKRVQNGNQNNDLIYSVSDNGQSYYEAQAQEMKEALDEIELKAQTAEKKLDTLISAIDANKKVDKSNIVRHDAAQNDEALDEQQHLPGMKKIAGYDYERRVLDEEFIQKVKLEKQGEDVDIPSSVLFFGPSANGKTSMTTAIAEDTGCDVKRIKVTGKTYKPEGQTEALEEIKQIAQASEDRFNTDRTRTIIFIDEIDKLINDNSSIKEEFLEFIKDCSKNYHCSVFGATNNPLNMGIDFSNPDIFPIVMSIDPADEQNKLKIIEHYLKGFNLNIDSKKILSRVLEQERAQGAIFTNQQIRNLCVQVLTKKLTSESTQEDAEKLMDEWFNRESKTRKGVKINAPKIDEQLAQKFQHDYDIVMSKGDNNED